MSAISLEDVADAFVAAQVATFVCIAICKLLSEPLVDSYDSPCC